MALLYRPMNQLVLLVELVLVLVLVHPGHSWCSSLGWNPSWSGPPVVERVGTLPNLNLFPLHFFS